MFAPKYHLFCLIQMSPTNLSSHFSGLVWLALVIASFASCQPQDQKSQNKIAPNFDIPSLMQELSKNMNTVDHKVYLNTQIDQNLSDSLISNPDWAPLLEPFMPFDLNKPSVSAKIRTRIFEGSRGTKLAYAPIKDEKLKFKLILIAYTQSNKLKSVRISTEDDNLLFQQRSTLLIELDTLYEKPMVSSLQIKKNQKFTIGNKTSIKVNAFVRMLPNT